MLLGAALSGGSFHARMRSRGQRRAPKRVGRAVCAEGRADEMRRGPDGRHASGPGRRHASRAEQTTCVEDRAGVQPHPVPQADDAAASLPARASFSEISRMRLVKIEKFWTSLEAHRGSRGFTEKPIDPFPRFKSLPKMQPYYPQMRIRPFLDFLDRCGQRSAHRAEGADAAKNRCGRSFRLWAKNRPYGNDATAVSFM